MTERIPREPADGDERLGEAVEQFMALAETGEPPDPEAFATRYPDLGSDLLEAIEGLSLLRGLVGAPGEVGKRLESGRRLAGYRIVRELGSGGMGVVYEAVHVDLDRPVALKVLDARATRSPSGLRRFQDEAKMAAGLHHTHIVPVFDVGNVGGLCYYAMQRIEGSGLDRVLRALRRSRPTAAGSSSSRPASAAAAAVPSLADSAASGSLSWPAPAVTASVTPLAPRDEAPAFVPPKGSAYFRWVAEAGRQAAQALAHAHGRGVIHRDIKPSNLLVDARGTIWVTDFGLARRLADPSLTNPDGFLGTPRYMSPEQARPAGPIDGRTDVYSLGATLYEMLTLRPPFEGRSAVELVQQIGDRDPVPPRRHDSRIPRDLETIALKALAKRPGDRFDNAAELADDLGRFLRHEPVRARRIGPLGRVWRMARRHPAVALVSTAATIAVISVVTVAYLRILKERDRARLAESQTRIALRKTEAANHATSEAMREQLLSSATLVRMSHVPNLRAQGLGLLAKAVRLGPGPALRDRLRDEAVQFLALRDVEARREIPTGRTPGLAFALAGTRLATLSEDGTKLTLWDIARREPQGRPADTGPAPEDDETTAAARASGTPGPPLPGPRIASTGPLTAVIWPNHKGIRLFDTATGAPPFDLPTPAHDLLALYAAPGESGPRLLTIDMSPAEGAQPNRPSRRPRFHLWDPTRPEGPIATLGDVTSNERPWPLVALAPDGETIATAWAREQVASLWSGKDGHALGTIDTQTPLTSLALGPDDLLAAAGGGAVRLWQIRTRNLLPMIVTPQRSFVTLLRFSPDGTLLAVAGPGTDVELWDPAGNALVAALPTSERVTDLAFAPTGRMLVAGQESSTAAWAIVDSTVRMRFTGLSAGARSLAFGPDGVLGMAFLGDAPARFWDPSRCPTTAHQREEFKPTALAGDGRQWLAASGTSLSLRTGPDANAAEWQVDLPEAGPQRGRFRGQKVQAIARTPDGRTIVLSRTNEVLVWSADEPGRVRRISPPPSEDLPARPGRGPGRLPWWWWDLAIAPAGDRLFLADHAGEFQAWALSGDRAERLDWSLLPELTAMALAPDGRTLALGERSGAVLLADANRGTIRSRIEADSENESLVTALAFSSDGRELAVGTRQGIVRLWEVGSASISPASSVRLPGHRGAVISLAYQPGGTRLATGGEDKTVDVWDLARLRRELKTRALEW